MASANHTPSNRPQIAGQLSSERIAIDKIISSLIASIVIIPSVLYKTIA